MKRRICIIGDPHIFDDEKSVKEANEMVDSINALNPDAVFVLGDLSGGEDKGAPEITELASDILSGFNCPWTTAVGNHDLQHTSFKTDEESLSFYLKTVGRKTPWDKMDVKGLRVLVLGNQQWRQNKEQHNEIVIKEDQIKWLEKTLNEYKENPCIIISHVPPVQADVLVNRNLHQISRNTYINQNHLPYEIMELIKKNPQIIMWTSAHNHLGHDYFDSVMENENVIYMHTGVHGSLVTRDEFRHSRILDFTDNDIVINTFDHKSKKILNKLKFNAGKSAEDYLFSKIKLDFSSCFQKYDFDTSPAEKYAFEFKDEVKGPVSYIPGKGLSFSNYAVKRIFRTPDSKVNDIGIRNDGSLYFATEGGQLEEHYKASVRASGCFMKWLSVKKIQVNEKGVWAYQRYKERGKVINKVSYVSFDNENRHQSARQKVKTFPAFNFPENILDLAPSKDGVLVKTKTETYKLKEKEGKVFSSKAIFSENPKTKYYLKSNRLFNEKKKKVISFSNKYSAYGVWEINNKLYVALERIYKKKLSNEKDIRHFVFMIEKDNKEKAELSKYFISRKELTKNNLLIQGKYLGDNVFLEKIKKTENSQFLYKLNIIFREKDFIRKVYVE